VGPQTYTVKEFLVVEFDEAVVPEFFEVYETLVGFMIPSTDLFEIFLSMFWNLVVVDCNDSP
jgi:hypothetical protein